MSPADSVIELLGDITQLNQDVDFTKAAKKRIEGGGGSKPADLMTIESKSDTNSKSGCAADAQMDRKVDIVV